MKLIEKWFQSIMYEKRGNLRADLWDIPSHTYFCLFCCLLLMLFLSMNRKITWYVDCRIFLIVIPNQLDITRSLAISITHFVRLNRVFRKCCVFVLKLLKLRCISLRPLIQKNFMWKRFMVSCPRNKKNIPFKICLGSKLPSRQVEYLREIGFMQRNYASMVSLGFISSNQCI